MTRAERLERAKDRVEWAMKTHGQTQKQRDHVLSAVGHLIKWLGVRGDVLIDEPDQEVDHEEENHEEVASRHA